MAAKTKSFCLATRPAVRTLLQTCTLPVSEAFPQKDRIISRTTQLNVSQEEPLLIYMRPIGDRQRKFKQGPLHPPLAGVIYLSVPFYYDNRRPIRRHILEKYYGSDSEEVWGVGYLKTLDHSGTVH